MNHQTAQRDHRQQLLDQARTSRVTAGVTGDLLTPVVEQVVSLRSIVHQLAWQLSTVEAKLDAVLSKLADAAPVAPAPSVEAMVVEPPAPPAPEPETVPEPRPEPVPVLRPAVGPLLERFLAGGVTGVDIAREVGVPVHWLRLRMERLAGEQGRHADYEAAGFQARQLGGRRGGTTRTAREHAGGYAPVPGHEALELFLNGAGNLRELAETYECSPTRVRNVLTRTANGEGRRAAFEQQLLANQQANSARVGREWGGRNWRTSPAPDAESAPELVPVRRGRSRLVDIAEREAMLGRFMAGGVTIPEIAAEHALSPSYTHQLIYDHAKGTRQMAHLRLALHAGHALGLAGQVAPNYKWKPVTK